MTKTLTEKERHIERNMKFEQKLREKGIVPPDPIPDDMDADEPDETMNGRGDRLNTMFDLAEKRDKDRRDDDA